MDIDAGAHLSPFERALGRCLLSLNNTALSSLDDLADVKVVHENYWMSDAGTSWPEETSIVYHVFLPPGANNIRGVSRRLYSAFVGLAH